MWGGCHCRTHPDTASGHPRVQDSRPLSEGHLAHKPPAPLVGDTNLQGEGQRQIRLHLSTGGQHNLMGSQDPLGALGMRCRALSMGQHLVPATQTGVHGRCGRSGANTGRRQILCWCSLTGPWLNTSAPLLLPSFCSSWCFPKTLQLNSTSTSQRPYSGPQASRGLPWVSHLCP